MMTLTQTIQSNIITFHDAITDSPIYRATSLHFDNQLDLFSQWIDDLAVQIKSYAEKLKDLNTETTTLASKLIPSSIVDEYLLGSKVTGTAATNFGEALKANLAFKIKMVSDLEDKFTQPIQQFANQHIHGFKDFRTQHKQALMDYENVLAKYGTLSSTDNDAAFAGNLTKQLNATRKKYVEMSSEHVLRILKLRHELEHCLIERFSATTTSRKDFYNDAQVWKQLDIMLFSWTEWLTQDKQTGRVELEKQKLAIRTLEKEYLEGLQGNGVIKTNDILDSKSGYLFVKSSDDTSTLWKRQWFFVHNGYFGSCKMTDTERSIKVTVDECVPLQSCTLGLIEMENHRFGFKLVSRQDHYKSLFVLQAENQQDMDHWLAVIRSKTTNSVTYNIRTPIKTRPSSIIIGSYDSNNDLSQPRSPALLIAKSKSTTVVSTPTDIPVTLSINSTSNLSGYSNLSNLSSSPGGTIRSNSSATQSITSARTTVLITCTSLDKHDEIRLSTIPSAISSMLNHITKELHSMETPFDSLTNDPGNLNSKLWGTPRSAISHTPDLTSSDKKSGTMADGFKELCGKTVWPWQYDKGQCSTPDIPGYTAHLDDKNQELRQLFNGVSFEEVVMDVFAASFLRKQDSIKTPGNLQKSESSGYHYGGYIFATQTTLWFYSSISSNCITTVALKWEDVEEIQAGEDAEITLSVVDGNRRASSLVFSMISDDVEIVVQKLRFLVYNAKLTDPMQLRNIYRKMVAMSASPPSLSSSSSTSSSSFSSYTQQNSLETPSYLSAPPCSNKSAPPRLASRMISSETTATVDTTKTLATQSSETSSKISPPNPTASSLQKPSVIDPDALPMHISKPSEPITCNCEDHLDRCDAQVELPISAKRLFRLMFSDELTGPPTDGGVWNSKTQGIHGRDLRVTSWESADSTGQMKRVLKYWMPVANPVVRMKEAEVAETQVVLKKDDYLCYVVQISTKTEALPFADAFVPSVRYCITYIDDSRCKLSCYLGVKWLKWVMAKLIVTKAALSGMSDSIKTFIPVLEEAAKSIQTTVDNIQQSNNSCNSTDLDDKEITVTSTLDTSHVSRIMTTTITEEPSQLSEISSNGQQQQHSAVVKTSISSSNMLSGSTSGAVAGITGSWTDCVTSIINPISFTSILKIKTSHFHQLIKTNLPPTWMTTSSTAYSLPRLWAIGVIILGCLLYVILSSFESSCYSSLSYGQNPVPSHAVYLRDLEEGFIMKSMRPPYSRSKSYDDFIKARQDEQNYTWHAGRHYRLALKYRTSREQLGVLRHNMLTLFQALNTEDASLLENEYLNWLLDNRQRCRDDRKLIQQQALEYNDTSSYVCDQVSLQIGTYF